MSDLLSVGASGVRAYQTALGTVSENIANAGTAGYSRRTVDTRDVAPATASPLAASRVLTGNGVVVAGVNRATDMFKSAAVRAAGADLARTAGGAVWLDRIDAALTGNALGDRITSFFTSATALAADPTSTAARATMLEQANTAAGAFRATGAALAQAASDLDATADQATGQLDALGQSLATVNAAMSRAGSGTAAAASLADQRDAILEQMSALVDVSAQVDSVGRATVRLGGSGGPVFVAGSETGSVTFVRNGEGEVSYAVHRNGTTAKLTPQGGALAGIADGALRLADAGKALDTLAGEFVDGVNAIQRNGRDLDGAPGGDMFAVGTAPTDISLALTSPAGIAAASVGGGPRDNGNLTALADFRASSRIEQRLTNAVTGNAATIAARRTVAEAQGAIRDNAVAERDAVSGVDLDNEAVDLLRFQQAYQASSRVIQVARETLQSILEIR